MASGAEEFKAFEAAGWSRRADTYGRVSGAITARFVNPILDAACVAAGMRVLDVATGPGHVAAAAAARGAQPVGVDIAEGMLAVARRDHPQLDFRRVEAGVREGQLLRIAARSRPPRTLRPSTASSA